VETLVILAAIAGAAVFTTWYWSEAAKIRRLLRSARRVAIADAPEGSLVRLQGRVVGGDTLQAPLTGRRCVYYYVVVDERVSDSDSGSWRGRIRESRGVPFVIDDGTGHALIDPTHARADVELDVTLRSGTFSDPDPTPSQLALLTRHEVETKGWLFNKTLRYREGVLAVGESIAILCQAVREPVPEATSAAAGYRDAPPMRLRVNGSVNQPLVISDARDVTRSS
jgi:hypothetical protein